jgi:hypothetical protein
MKYDFDTPVNEDIILYTGWEKKEGPAPEDDDFGIYSVRSIDLYIKSYFLADRLEVDGIDFMFYAGVCDNDRRLKLHKVFALRLKGASDACDQNDY